MRRIVTSFLSVFLLSLAGCFLYLTTSTSQAGEPAPPLLSAGVYQPGIALADYWVSEKLDGVRAYWDGRRLVSRRGNPLQAPPWFTRGFPAIALDGELWMGRGTFERLSAAVRRHVPDDAEWRQVRYMVFDLPAVAGTFDRRLARLRRLFENEASPYIAPVAQFRVRDHRALMHRLEQVVAGGGEGLMLHRGDSHYRAARPGDLLKLKPHTIARARVTGHTAGKGKYVGMLGALEVITPQGVQFNIGTGLSDAERRNPPPLGSIITYRHSGTTARGVPRFASFLGVEAQ